MKDWPFVARDEEIAQLNQALTATAGGAAIVSGPAGIGKSRLAEQVLDSLDPDKYDVIRVRATEAMRQIPFGAFAHVLPAISPQTDGNPLGWALAALADPSPRTAAVLWADDAHLLDHVSISLLGHLATDGTTAVLLTLRAGDSPPEPVRALWRAHATLRIYLEPLGAEPTARLLERALRGRVEAATANRLWRGTEGNPLMLFELVRSGLAKGTLRDDSGSWRLTGELPIDCRLIELIAERIGALGPALTRVAELTALAEPVDLAVLAALCTTVSLEAAEAAGVIQLVGAGPGAQVTMIHPLYGEMLRQTMPRLRMRHYLCRLADAMEQHGTPRRDDVIRLAIWRLDSGSATDPAPLLRAGVAAWEVLDVAMAERLARAALRLGAGVRATILLAAVLEHTDRYAEAEAVLAEAWDVPCEDQFRLSMAGLWAFAALVGRQDSAAADQILADVAEVLPEPDHRQHLALTRAALRIWHGQLQEGHGLAAAVHDAPATPALREQALYVRSSAFVAAGRLDRARTEARQAIETWSPGPERIPTVLMFLHHTVAESLALLGDLDAYDAAVESFVARFPPGEPSLARAHVSVATAVGLRLRGQLTDATEVLIDAADDELPPPPFGPLAHAELAITAAMTGQAELAQRALKQANRRRVPYLAAATWAAELARPWVLAAARQRTRSVQAAIAIARRLRNTQLRTVELQAWHGALRLGAAGAVAADRLTELAACIDGEYAQRCAEQAVAVAQRDGVELTRIALAYQDRGLLPYAAEAAAQAVAAYHATGRRASAAAAQLHAWSLVRRCPGLSSPLIDALQTPALTAREMEVALLAASGLRSRQIADRLVVSRRTVDNHLQAVYGKLSIKSRVELSQLFPAGQR